MNDKTKEEQEKKSIFIELIFVSTMFSVVATTIKTETMCFHVAKSHHGFWLDQRSQYFDQSARVVPKSILVMEVFQLHPSYELLIDPKRASVIELVQQRHPDLLEERDQHYRQALQKGEIAWPYFYCNEFIKSR